VFKKSQTILEYGMLIAVIAVSFLGIQVYLVRGMKGNLQSAGAQLSDQYSYGSTDLDEIYTHSSSKTILNTPGINKPWEFAWTDGSYESQSERSLEKLKADVSD